VDWLSRIDLTWCCPNMIDAQMVFRPRNLLWTGNATGQEFRRCKLQRQHKFRKFGDVQPTFGFEFRKLLHTEDEKNTHQSNALSMFKDPRAISEATRCYLSLCRCKTLTKMMNLLGGGGEQVIYKIALIRVKKFESFDVNPNSQVQQYSLSPL